MVELAFQNRVALQRLPARERIIVLSGLVGCAMLAWIYVLYMSWGMAHMDEASLAIMPRMTNWGAVDLGLVLVMWAVMMAAMMLPSSIPMVLSFAALAHQRRARGLPYVKTSVFVLGYLAVWAGFSFLATFAQWGLLEARLVTPMMVSATPWLAGALLVAAGAFQLTPWKHRCLTRCTSPFGFLLNEWRDGAVGAWVMGFRHGLFCLGCCGALMALLFVFGVMNTLWVAALSIYVMLEKLLPRARWLPFAAGPLLIVWGLAVAAAV
jgi:predicted metal-binding membrane protein